MLKEEEKEIFVVRADWKSPTRPQTLRTAISPRFRNTQADYTTSVETFKRPGQGHSSSLRQGQNLTERTDHEKMNFDAAEQFQPPEGTLIYKRLYKKDLAQLDKH